LSTDWTRSGLDIKRKDEAGLFAGVREVTDKALGVSDYASKGAALALKERGYSAEAARSHQPKLDRCSSGREAFDIAGKLSLALPTNRDFRSQ
jgi:hypothetical protein